MLKVCLLLNCCCNRLGYTGTLQDCMKRLLTTIVLSLMACACFAQSAITIPASAQVWYDLKYKSLTPVVASQIGVLNKFGGKLDVPVYTFAGYNTQSTRGVLGVSTGLRWQAASNLSLLFGPGVTVQSNRPVSFGFIVGFDIKL